VKVVPIVSTDLLLKAADRVRVSIAKQERRNGPQHKAMMDSGEKPTIENRADVPDGYV